MLYCVYKLTITPNYCKINLMRINKMNLNELKLAYIAKYAPDVNTTKPIKTALEEKVYSQYHYDIYTILSGICPNIITSNSPNLIMDHHKEIDYTFSLLNRAPYKNSEIFITSLLEYYKIPYLGARPNIRALAEDKQLSKMMCRYCDVKTPNWITYNINDTINDIPPFEGPFFVKPRFGASSMYINEQSICYTWEEVKQRVAYLYDKNTDVIVEELIDGIFYSSPVFFDNFNPVFLPPVCETSTLKGNVVTYAQKRKIEGGLIRTIELNNELNSRIIACSEKLLKYIQPIDYVRFDYMITHDLDIYFLEFNVCCNLGKQSAFILSANSINMTQKNLVEKIFINSIKRQGLI